MRARCAVLLTLLSMGSLVFAAGGTAASLPGSGYAWAQPATAVMPMPFAQASVWISITAPVLVASVPGSGYVWAQPPASIPTE